MLVYVLDLGSTHTHAHTHILSHLLSFGMYTTFLAYLLIYALVFKQKHAKVDRDVVNNEVCPWAAPSA